MKPKLTIEEELDVIKLKNDGYKNSYIRNKYGISQSCLQKVIRRCGREHLIPNKIYNVNQDYFDKIDNQDKAYWLGFLYADGYVRLKNGKSGHLKIRLKNTDIEHLKLFNDCIKSSYPIKNDIISKVVVDGKDHTSLCCELHIYNTKLVKDLFKWGCVNKKSMIIEFPTFLDNELIRHFIRGYFDGDGCVYKNRIGFVSGSINFMTSLKSFLDLNFLKNDNSSSFKEGKYYILEYSTDLFFINFYNYIYRKSTIFLKRKKLKFDNVILNKCHSSIEMYNNGVLIKKWNHINDCSRELKIGTRKIMKMIKGELPNHLNLKLGVVKNFNDSIIIERFSSCQ